jgi:glyoxylase-like metal-dependent hydrolase (beta-lactamase superfamily II)
MSEIAPGIHRIEEDLGPRFMAQYVLVGGERTVLVDSGLSQTLDEAIAPYLESIGLAVDALDDLIVSHADVDHVGSNRRLRERSPRTRVWCGESDRPWIESNARMLAENYRWFEPHGFSLGDEALGWLERELGGDAPVDVGLRGGETLRLGAGQRWEVLALPGHTAGHIGLWHEGERIALVIDAVLGNGIRDRAGNLLIPPRIYDVAGYRQTISTLRALAPELLLTAHYPLMGRAEAAQFLDLCEAFCDDAVRVTRTLAAGGEPTLQALVAALDEELGPYPEFAAELAAIARSALTQVRSGAEPPRGGASPT